jgi:hypothetical protein
MGDRAVPAALPLHRDELAMIEVRLTSNDIRWATQVGQERWRRAQRKRSKARFAGAKEVDHIDGAGGELAFCRALNLPWPATVDSYHSRPDVFPNWEVRTLRRMRGVKVVPEDDDDRLVVWVQGQMPIFTVMGYIRVGGAKRHDAWLRDPGSKSRAIWLVPENRMIPIDHSFHSACALAPDAEGRWTCVHCGADAEKGVA